MNIFRLVHCDIYIVLRLRRHFSPHLVQNVKFMLFWLLLLFPHESDSMFTFTICTILNCKGRPNVTKIFLKSQLMFYIKDYYMCFFRKLWNKAIKNLNFCALFSLHEWRVISEFNLVPFSKTEPNYCSLSFQLKENSWGTVIWFGFLMMGPNW